MWSNVLVQIAAADIILTIANYMKDKKMLSPWCTTESPIEVYNVSPNNLTHFRPFSL